MSTSPDRAATGSPTSILWVEGSPKGDRSLSSSCARAFLESLGGDVGVTHLDVWSDEVVSFGREAALAKFAPLLGEERTAEQEAIWQQVGARIEQVERHDAILVSSPMWNWGIPHALKAWIDVVVQPFQSFRVDAEGRHVGLLGVGKRAQLILTRSSAYDGRSPEMEDHQDPYLRYLFELLGFDLAESVIVEPTTAWTPEEREAIAAEAVDRSRAAGLAFT
ncbi:FMN-dependent NADH-azoreductase [Ilumatobacter sp.]|uniref:FMN-dependent NADH-azoreductase n=1 Tax=Ilumatobacter sp. TaxID=1967498 RepID=UPI003C45D523